MDTGIGQKIKGKAQQVKGSLQQASGHEVRGTITKLKGKTNDASANVKLRNRRTRI